MKPLKAALPGEFAGTFLLVFFGCGSVVAAVTTGAQVGIFQVAIVWGIGIALAIHCTAARSGAHLNPAVTIAFSCWQSFPRAGVLPYIGAQLAGAFVAAAVLHLIFGSAISGFELANGIVRGAPGSEASAMVYGEFFPNPGGKPLSESALEISLGNAFFAEAVGTAILVFAIFSVIDPRNTEAPGNLAPAFIGLTVTILISLLAPVTMACFNPARDLGPRLFSTLAGWKEVPFTANGPLGWWLVYIVAPIVGGFVGGGAHRLLHSERGEPG